MQTVRCAACGRRYDYRQEGCCPRCGAYNRPPRREWVQADGTICHCEDRTQAQPRPGKVCYEGKVCFEEQARKSRKKPASTSAHGGERVVKSVQKPFKPRSSGRRGQNSSVGAALVGIVLLFVLIMVKNSGLLDHLGGDPDEIPATPKYNYENVIDVSCGEAFWITDDLALQFMGYLPDEEGQTNLFYLSNDYDRAMQLLSDGTITIDDEDGDTYVVPNVSYDWIRLDAPSDVQWQTLHIETTEGVITVRDLYPADDSMSEWLWMIPDEDTIQESLE